MESRQQQLINYITQVGEVEIPDSTNTVAISLLLPDLGVCSKLLFLFINNQQNDSSLLRLADDFHKNFDDILCGNLADFPMAIEGLAQKFESFLKKIGYFRFKDTDEWTGNATHEGIRDSTLKNLYDGKLVPKKNAPRGTRASNIPELFFTNTSDTYKFAEFVRKQLRNAVHQSPRYPKRILVTWAEYIFLTYLLVIRDNQQFLAACLLPESKSKETLNRYFAKWQNRYVQTLFIEQNRNDLAGLSPHIIETDWDIHEQTQQFIPKQGEILDILIDNRKIVIVGDPGLGKTTTLQFLGYHLSLQAKNLPVYFPFRDFISNQDLLAQIAAFAGLDISILYDYASQGDLVFLLDGINEVLNRSDAIDLKNQIKALIRNFDRCYLVLTSRPAAYKNDFNIPVFELQALDDQQIAEFIQKNFPSSAGQLTFELEAHSKLKELCRNPLILYFLCSVANQPPILIPANKGQLIKTFIDNILKREQHKNPQFDEFKFFEYLVAIGIKTRVDKRVSFNQSYLINIVGAVASKLEPAVDRIWIITSLVDAGLLSKNNNQLSFTHELYQEYFAAEGLLQELISDWHEFENSPDWEQPLILYSGLVCNPNIFIGEVSERNPILAIKCYESSVADDSLLRSKIIDNAFKISKQIEEIQKASNGLMALAKMGEFGLINESLESSVISHGEIVFRLLGQIAAVLVRTIDINYLVNFIKIALKLNQSFLPSIVRNLQKREPDGIKLIKSDLLLVFKPYLFSGLEGAYVYRFFVLTEINDPTVVGQFDLEEFCLKLCRQSNENVLQNKNSAWNLIKHFHLYLNEKYIKKVLSYLADGKRANHVFIKQISEYNQSLINFIIDICLNSKNISSQCTGIVIAVQNGLENQYYHDLVKLSVFRDNEKMRLLRSIASNESFNDRISVIYNHQQIFLSLLELDNSNRKFRCRVTDISELEIAIRSKHPRFTGIIRRSEATTKKIKKEQNLSVHIAFIDYAGKKAYFTQTSPPIENYYHLCQLPAPGDEVRSRIAYLHEHTADVMIQDKFYGILTDVHLTPDMVGKRIKTKIIEYRHGVYKLEYIKPESKQVRTFKQIKNKQYKQLKQNKPESDFAIVLNNALKKI